LADIEPLTLCLDPTDIDSRICERTKAIVVVHYSGYPCDMESGLCRWLKKYHL
jgi:dTDP-4-amino-4,6-dideoxygalactose transaminase